MIVDVDYYQYNRVATDFERETGQIPKTVEFISAEQATTRLSEDSSLVGMLQIVIAEKFSACNNYKAMKNERTRLKAAPCFNYYQKKNRTVNDAALDLTQGKRVSDFQRRKVEGLDQEIEKSLTNVKRGQKCFHGLSNSQFLDIAKEGVLTHFFSTSLSVTVAMNHALRRSGRGVDTPAESRPTVLIVTIQNDFRAIFAEGYRESPEYEILFSRNAKIVVRSVKYPKNGAFQIAEVDLVGFA